MSYQKDRDEFVGVIVSECNAQRHPQERGTVTTYADAVAIARSILRNAATIQRLAEQACNHGQSDTIDNQAIAAQQRIAAACAPWGIVPHFNGDPRGAVVKLTLPSGRWNSAGGPEYGYCVPTR